MYKLVRWAYKLGYHQAEERYYHALRSRIYYPDRPEAKASDEQKFYYKLHSKVADQLTDLLESTFHPTEYKEVAPKNRFEP